MAKRVGVDKWLFFTTLVLVVTGLVMVFSASAVVDQARYHSAYTFVLTQGIWALLGVMTMLVLMHVDVSHYNSPRFIYPALCITTVLLLLVFLMPGSHHTHRWIRFGDFFTFQPSEIAKPVLVLFLAWFLHNRLGQMRDWRQTLVPAALIPVLFTVLVVAQPDLGTALVLAGVTAMMLVLAGMEWRYLLAGACAAAPALAALLLWVPWRRERLLVFLSPESDPLGAGYHIYQSLIAVGTGGLTGRGYMEGMQKLFYLPEASTDFIFANIAEELGFIGAMFIVLLFVTFGVRGLRTAFRSSNPFARLAAFGITITILLQAFFNISVVLSLVPNKGIPLPLISHGGTSLFCTLASIGILLSISRQAE
ncbi:Lipid II flippase FtsW [Candidatus Sulfotelmatomonas gaucii]|uniref:Probable peptidoglycan glycosyltransferase FtsW n=1 Tax=Candidatus Sulfuritelmatomonas gaucii TaxID=2043161 RepID=A0A2N9LQE2_9BACT|nr:Lipid II flippase FtsW [Candidatus Sulfotelmatomonas gaucii]